MTAKKLQKSDLIFLLSLLAGLILYIAILHIGPDWEDESFYSTIALRIVNGDSLIADEWHLSQFASVFLYLPVKLWLVLNGSTDGIILFLRCIYLAIHTGSAVGLYAFFRKKGVWAVAAALLFYTQSPMRIMNLSYNSLFALFLIAIGVLLLAAAEKQKPIFYLLAGVAFACACVCNAVFCTTILVYITALLITLYIYSDFRRQNILLTNKERKKRNKKLRPLPQTNPVVMHFFSKKAVLFFFAGIGIAALACLVFFFATGGTLSAFSETFKHLLTDSEHDVFASPFAALWAKLKQAAEGFNIISLKLFFLPILLLVALTVDKKRKANKHRIIFVFLSFTLSLFYTVSISYTTITGEKNTWLFSFPLFLFSLVCYILTQNKNRIMFCCFWLPSVLASFAQFLASNLSLLSIGWVLAIANIGGVFFIHDLFRELQANADECKKEVKTAAKVVLCIAICTQIAFQCIAVLYGRTPEETELTQVQSGPYEDLYLPKKYYGTFELSMQDLDKIKDMSEEDDPVLILSDMTWLYLYVDRPFGTYSAWQLSFEPERLKAYYELNPERAPKYIYVSAVVPRSGYGVSFKTAENTADVMKEMFNCTEKKLSRGILLTVTE